MALRSPGPGNTLNASDAVTNAASAASLLTTSAAYASGRDFEELKQGRLSWCRAVPDIKGTVPQKVGISFLITSRRGIDATRPLHTLQY